MPKRNRIPPSRRPAKAKLSPTEMLRKIVQMQVALGRHFGDEDDKIRADVKAAFQKALSSNDPPTIMANVEGIGPTEMVDHTGMFKFVFSTNNLDRSNQVAQETWFELISQALEVELVATRKVG